MRLVHETFGDPASLIGWKDQVIWVAMVSGAESAFSNVDWLKFKKLSCMSLILDSCHSDKSILL